MSLFSNVKLAKRLPLLIAIPAISIVAIAGGIQVWMTKAETEAQNTKALSSFLHERGSTLNLWIEGIEEDVVSVAQSQAIIAGLQDFTAAWKSYEGEVVGDLRRLYISDNPNPIGSKDELDDAKDGSAWSQAHNTHHPGLRAYQRARGYYDVFFFDMEGDLVYSVFKEDDFALNFVTGKYAQSGLGEVFQKGRDIEKGHFYQTTIEGYAPSAGAPAMFISTPVFAEGVQIGVLAIQVPLDVMSRILSDSELLGETGIVYLVDEDLRTLSNSPNEGSYQALDTFEPSPQITAALAGDEQFFSAAAGIEHPEVIAMGQTIVTPNGAKWGMVIEKDRGEAMALVTAAIKSTLIEVVIMALFLTLAAWAAARGVVKRIERLSDDMGEVTAKRFDHQISDTESGDEIGAIARTLTNLKDSLEAGAKAQARESVVQEENAQVVRLLTTALKDLSKGDFRNQVTEFFPVEHKKLRYSINDAMDRLNAVIMDVGDTAQSILRGAGEVSASADELASRTESQAATLEQTAAALEEVTSSVRSSTEHVQNVENIVQNAHTHAEKSGTVVHQSIEAMNEIEQSSQKISQIITVIDDIAFQTNLLALNAGVEAARAGEAGRGFAVVASEVRGLAQRSADAALEIKTLIETSGRQVARGVKMVGETGEALGIIVSEVQHISDLVTQVAKSSQEQSTALGEITMGMTQLDQVTQSNAAMVEQSTAASHMLTADAKNLFSLVSTFKTQDAALEVSSDQTTAPEPTAALSPPEMDHEEMSEAPEVPQPQPQPQTANQKWSDF